MAAREREQRAEGENPALTPQTHCKCDLLSVQMALCYSSRASVVFCVGVFSFKGRHESKKRHGLHRRDRNRIYFKIPVNVHTTVLSTLFKNKNRRLKAHSFYACRPPTDHILFNICVRAALRFVWPPSQCFSWDNGPLAYQL